MTKTFNNTLRYYYMLHILEGGIILWNQEK